MIGKPLFKMELGETATGCSKQRTQPLPNAIITKLPSSQGKKQKKSKTKAHYFCATIVMNVSRSPPHHPSNFGPGGCQRYSALSRSFRKKVSTFAMHCQDLLSLFMPATCTLG